MANKFLDLNGFKYFINKIIGKTSIAGIGDGTLTGAISDLGTEYISRAGYTDDGFMFWDWYNDGRVHMFGKKQMKMKIANQDGALYFSDKVQIYLPRAIKFINYQSVTIASDTGAWAAYPAVVTDPKSITFWVYAASAYNQEVTMDVFFDVIGG